MVWQSSKLVLASRVARRMRSSPAVEPGCASALHHRIEALRPLGMLARPCRCSRQIGRRPISLCVRLPRLYPPPIAPQVHVQPRTEAEALVLADLRQPQRALAQARRGPCPPASGSRARGPRAASRHQRAHLLQIVRLRDHELQLILVSRHQLRQHVRLNAQPLVLRRPRGPSGVELASLGLMLIRSQATGWNTVPAVSMVMCRPRCAQPLGQRDDLRRDHRLAAGDHHVPRGMRRHLVQNLVRVSDRSPSGCHEV